MLLVFAATFAGGMLLLYFVSRSMLLSSFRELENAQMHQDVQYARLRLDRDYNSLARTANDYAYWDTTYEFMGNPKHGDIGQEFQDEAMDGLGLSLVLLRSLEGKTVYSKSYDLQQHQASKVSIEFAEKLLGRTDLSQQNLARSPKQGMLLFPDGIYVLSICPILNSARKGESRGIFLAARRFSEGGTSHVSEMTQTSIRFARFGPALKPADFQSASEYLGGNPGEILIRPLSEEEIAGYSIVNDIFARPLLVMRVDTSRPIYERGKLSQVYLFGAVLSGGVLFSLVIIFFLQKFVLSPLGGLSRDVGSIGQRKAISERVGFHGPDELGSLADSINGMLGELEKSQQQFLFVAENIRQVFWTKDAHTGSFEYISNAFDKIWSRPRIAVLKDPALWREAIHPGDAAVVEKTLQSQSSGKPTEAYYRITKENGETRWLWDRSFPSFAPDGSLRQVIGLTEDITEFKRNEEALLKSQEDLEVRVRQRTAELAERSELVKMLLDWTPVAMYGMDSQGNVSFCNPAALAIFGYQSVEEVLGKHSHTLFHHSRPDGADYALDDCPIFACFRNGENAHVVDEVFWRKDGTAVAVEYDSQRILRDDQVAGVVVAFADITERKRQEIELRHGQKLEAVGRLAAGIAHEINTPIQFVGDNTRFLQNSFRDELDLIHKYEELRAAAEKGTVTPDLLQQVAKVRETADWPYLEQEIPRAMEQMLEGLSRVSTIVRGMKEFSHVDRSNEKAPGDLNRALESTLIVARNELKYVADVETHFDELPPLICHLGDLNQVFLNLLVNAAHSIGDAVKGTVNKGKIKVTTRLDGDWVEVAIGDSGMGIPEDVREKIFDPFFTTKGVGKGTGQGLALARAIVVEKHGGTLTFETQIGKGTTFFVRLPLAGAALREETVLK